jgi:hypothetical protein
MPPSEQLKGSVRLLIKTIMANTPPVVWLFCFQPLLSTTSLKVRFDGIIFWIIYALFSALFALVMWLSQRTQPDPTYKSSDQVPTPVRGVVAASFQLLVYFGVMAAYLTFLKS